MNIRLTFETGRLALENIFQRLIYFFSCFRVGFNPGLVKENSHVGNLIFKELVEDPGWFCTAGIGFF